jgi:dihydrofolate reductase
MTELPKLVVSRTLIEPLVWKNSSVIPGELARKIRALKAQSGDVVRSVGSIRLVASLLEHGLVDRLRLMTFPVLLGDAGREPVHAVSSRIDLRLSATTVLDSRIVLLEYEPTASRKSS